MLEGYAFDSLWSDDASTLYRGKSSVAPPVLLLVLSEYPRPEALKRLEHEHSLRDELDASWAARPRALPRYQERAALLLDDPGGVPLERLVGQVAELGQSLRLAVGLAGALSELHRRGIVHKDIKPANVLADPATGRCFLTGFGVASRLPRERHGALPPEAVAGTLAYMAPEQTGRMNRSIDSRSDLYSLGVTLYELLSGVLPFHATEPIEWVHCHIAKPPVALTQRVRTLPSVVSAIVMKLLAKTAEDRYQTAGGVEVDLQRCLREWEARGRIEDFELARQDTPTRPQVPEKLYGRSREIAQLLESFDRVVASGRPELVLVSGYSGIGKSSVVNELHKVLVMPRGLFASGKFDQYKRDIPYAKLAEAFRGLVRSLLSKTERELSGWRESLRAALGESGRLIADLVPELALVIGEQPPVVELPALDAQVRFHQTFARFIAVFARPEHPLALFLDDLQWLDAATLDLLVFLFTSAELRHLLVIGAYRDNEVGPEHALTRKVELLQQGGAAVQELRLGPLTRTDVVQLLGDFLHESAERVAPLAELVHGKTAGNPFFAIQFCYALLDEALLTLDPARGRWLWDLERIVAKGYTDNVVELMAGKLHRLPPKTQRALQELACLGSSAKVAALSVVLGASSQVVHESLWSAVRQELIAPTGDAYVFAHDRVQEAAYSSIPADERAAAHLRIARLLVDVVLGGEDEGAIFEVVNQYNQAEALLTTRPERERVAGLNLAAGTRAKASAAYGSALRYFAAGCRLLDDASWAKRSELVFPLELQRAECEFMTGALAAADEHLATLASRVNDATEHAKVVCLRVDLYTTLNQSDRAVLVCLEYLKRLGVQWSPHPSAEEASREYERVQAALGGRSTEALLQLPLMTDAESLATMDVLTKVFPAAVFTDVNLLSLTASWAVNLSLTRGNCDGSCVAYLFLGMVAGPVFGNYRAGFELGRLGYELVEKRGLHRFRARTYAWFAQFVIPWTRHVRECCELTRRAFDVANESHDLTVAAYSCNNLNTYLLAAGTPLDDVQHEAEKGLAFAEKSRFGFVADIITAQLGLIRSLRGTTRRLGSLEREGFDERAFEQHLASEPSLALPECWYWVRKLQARWFAGEVDDALSAAAHAERLLWTSPSLFESAEYHFYAALARAAACESASPEARAVLLAALAEHRAKLEVWAENCPENFDTRASLVAAELARLEGRPLDAEQLYQRAIDAARRSELLPHEALGSELAGRFYAERGLERVALAYLGDARYCYLRWGADAKARQLDELYPKVRQDSPATPATQTSVASFEHLDLAAIMKAAQAVSSEIVGEKLLDTLLRTSLEHAGAERGVLILTRGGEPSIEAEASTREDGIDVRLRRAELSGSALPVAIVQYVLRTLESVLLDDASLSHPFTDEPYLSRSRSRSVLCLPLVNQGQLVGALYLENRLAPYVFTPARTALLRLLASQAAVSLENSRLYRDLQQREAKIRRLVDANIIGICIWNVHGDLLEANDAFLRILGRSRSELAAGELSWRSLTPTEWLGRDDAALSEVSLTGTVPPYEKEFARPDGTRVPVLIGAAMLGPGQDDGVAFILDLSEQKRATAALRLSEAQLAEARVELAHVTRVTTMGELTASIAHEINQPLTAVVSNASASLHWLNRATPDLEEAGAALRRIVRDGTRAGEVIARMRQLFKKTAPADEVMDVNAAVEEVVQFTHGEAQRRGVRVHTELASDLPRVLGDRVQLQQVVLNLIVNAIEAMAAQPGGERAIGVTSNVVEQPESATRKRAQLVLVEVRDSGPGLSGDAAARVFDAFFTTKAQGLGMGLAISRSIIQAHGGELWAVTDVPSGAAFRFSLPVAQLATG